MQLAIWLRGIPPSLGAMLEFQYIENGRFTFIISTILKQNDLRPGLFCGVRFFSSRVCSNGSIHQYMPEKQNGLLITFGLTQSLTWKGLSRDEQAAVHVALKSSRSRMLKETEDDPGQNSFQRRDCFRRSNLSLGVTKVL